MRLRTHHARVLAEETALANTEAAQDLQDLAGRLRRIHNELIAAMPTLSPGPASYLQAKADGIELALDMLREYPAGRDS